MQSVVNMEKNREGKGEMMEMSHQSLTAEYDNRKSSLKTEN